MPRLRFLVCPDKFKGSLSAPGAANAIRKGLRAVFPSAEILCAPLADGGEGFAAILSHALGCRTVRVPTQNAAGQPIRAPYGWNPATRTAVIELAAAAGLAQLPPSLRDPRTTSTFGAGLLVRDALRRGARTVLLGLGGSATNDAGAGIARALGWKFLDRHGRDLPPGGLALARLTRVEPPDPNPAAGVRIVAACDVTNPLCGPNGCAHVFAPQKGATPGHVRQLDAALRHLAGLTRPRPASRPGDGAAGGTAWGLRVFLGAELQSGFDIIADAIRLPELIARADAVFTGEGAFDAQSLQGKAVGRVLDLCRAAGVPGIVLAGSVPSDEKGLPFAPSLSILTGPMELSQATAQAARLLAAAATRAALILKAGGAIAGKRRRA